MKKTTKKTKKVTKPAFIVDLTNVTTPSELYAAFGLAKQDAKLPITDDELMAIINVAVNTTIEVLLNEFNELPHNDIEIKNGEKLVFDEKGNFKVKKPNIFRRFWNWITRKK